MASTAQLAANPANAQRSTGPAPVPDRLCRKLTGQEAAEVPAIASINDLTKQTQSEALALQMADCEVGVHTLTAIQKRNPPIPPAGAGLGVTLLYWHFHA